MTQPYLNFIKAVYQSEDGQDNSQTTKERGSKVKRIYSKVDFRHDRIVELYQHGVNGQAVTLKKIAEIVGMKDHSSVLYHVNGSCRCKDRNSYRFRKEIINKAKMWDTLKEAMRDHAIYEVMELMEKDLGDE